VVYSVYDDDFKNTLNTKFSEKLLVEGIDKPDVEVIKDPTFVNVSKLGINFSDAIIKGTDAINGEVEKYISSSGKPFLENQPKETYIDAYNDFYQKLF
jgi:starch synthase